MQQADYDSYGPEAAFFDTKKRKEFLKRSRRFCQYPRKDTALAHAFAVDIGRFSEDNLFRDVVTIFTAEMRSYQIEMGYTPSIDESEVRNSRIFQMAYNAARYLHDLNNADPAQIARTNKLVDLSVLIELCAYRMQESHHQVYQELRGV